MLCKTIEPLLLKNVQTVPFALIAVGGVSCAAFGIAVYPILLTEVLSHYLRMQIKRDDFYYKVIIFSILERLYNSTQIEELFSHCLLFTCFPSMPFLILFVLQLGMALFQKYIFFQQDQE